jgi:PTH1 family peptidyl-tRNA hydrolase
MASSHRLRLGIGHPGHKDKVTGWVLGRPSAPDEDAILDAIARAQGVLPLAVDGQFDKAMQQLHTSSRDS